MLAWIVRPVVGRVAVASLLGACALAAGIGLIATSAWLISRAAQRPPESDLALAIVGVQFFGLSRGLFRYGERLVGHDSAFRALAELRVRVFKHLERLAPAGLPTFERGDLLARLVHDVDSLQDLILRVIPPFVIAALVGGATVGLIWWALPAAGVVLLATLAVAAALVPWLTGRIAAMSESAQADTRADLTSAVLELLEGAPDLVANGAMPAQVHRTFEANDALTKVASSTARTSGVGLGVTTLLSGLAMWGALMLGVPAVHSGLLKGPLLAVIALVPLAAFELVSGLPGATQTFQRVRPAAARVLTVMKTPDPVVEPESPRALLRAASVEQAESLGVRYRDSASWALDGVDLALTPGRRVAVVGPSGAGKSTLALALLRLISYEAGVITLGGVPLEQLLGDDVRKVVGLVSQDAHIFDSTLRENLRLARREADPGELREALERCRLLSVVERLPHGLDTEVGEHGSRLSGGERQRLALARAVLADFPILVLDEPTEHLDIETSDAVLDDLFGMDQSWSVLLVTHRMRGLEHADEIIVLDRGRVVERGRHDELVSRRGRYAELVRREERERV